MVQIVQRPKSSGDRLAQGIFQGAAQGTQDVADLLLKRQADAKENEALKKATGLDLAGVSPELKQEFVKQYAKSNAEGDKNRQLAKDLKYMKSPSTADKLSGYEGMTNDEKFLKMAADIESSGHELSTSELDSLWKGIEGEQEPTIDDMENAEILSDILTTGGKNVGRLKLDQRKLRSEESRANQANVDKSYDVHKPYIDDLTSKYQGFETEMKPRLLQMQSMNDETLIGPSSAKFLEVMGIPLGALDDPGNELYQKLSQDLLKGLPETYGSRILKVEVDNFLKTIPTLLNSANGRRMIASNMLKLGQMKEVFYKEMRKQQIDNIDSNKKFPKDFEQRVFDNVKPQIDKLNSQFLKLAEVRDVPEGTIPFFNPSGGISFVPMEYVADAEKNGGERIW